MSDSVRPHPWDSPGKNIGVGCLFLLQCIKVKSESEIAQSCPTLCDPMECSLPGTSVHGIFQARVLEWGYHWLLLRLTQRRVIIAKTKKKVRVAQLCPTLCNPMDYIQGGLSRSEYWSGGPFPSPDLSNPGIEPRSPTLQGDSLPAELQGKPKQKRGISFM